MITGLQIRVKTLSNFQDRPQYITYIANFSNSRLIVCWFDYFNLYRLSFLCVGGGGWGVGGCVCVCV